MRRSRPNRLIALLAAFALFFATSAYLAHGLKADGGPHHYTHCDLCLQFGATAGPSAPPALHSPLALVVRTPAPGWEQSAPVERKFRTQQPRAPPQPFVI